MRYVPFCGEKFCLSPLSQLDFYPLLLDVFVAWRMQTAFREVKYSWLTSDQRLLYSSEIPLSGQSLEGGCQSSRLPGIRVILFFNLTALCVTSGLK